MRKLFNKNRRKVLSSLFTNLSAGWIGAIFIFSNFSNLAKLNDTLILISNIVAAKVKFINRFLA